MRRVARNLIVVSRLGPGWQISRGLVLSRLCCWAPGLRCEEKMRFGCGRTGRACGILGGIVTIRVDGCIPLQIEVELVLLVIEQHL